MNLINELHEWFNFIGVDLNSPNINLNQFEQRNYAISCKSALELDKSMFSTIIYFRASVKDYLENNSIKLKHLILEDSLNSVQDKIKQLKKFNELVNSTDKNILLNSFKNNLKEQLLKNNIINESNISELINDDLLLADILLKSLMATQNLRVNQFYQGNYSDKEPIFSQFLYEFDDVNDLISSLCNTKSDSLITLNLIKDNQIKYETYFCFGIKNGQNIYIIHNKNNDNTPMKKYKTRSSDKQFAKKIFDSYFPYEDVLDLSLNNRGGVYINKSSETEIKDIVKLNKPKELKLIKELNPETITWLLFMFENLKENYFTNKTQKELSYSGKLISNLELDNKNKNNLVIYNKNDNKLKPLTLSDISNKSLENFWERKPQEVNLWIEKKFENEIDLNNLNLFEGDRVKLIEYMDKDVVDRNLTLKTFEPLTLKMNDFGTKEELIRQQKYIARYNKALMIEAKNKKYYHENKDNIINWYIEQVNKNRDNILKYVAENNLIVKEYNYHNFYSEQVPTITNKNIVKKELNKGDFAYYNYKGIVLKREDGREIELSNSRNSVLFVFDIINSEAISKILNLKIEDLPEELKNYSLAKPYIGNQTLSFIDPMDWIVKNNWNKLKLNIKVFLTKTEYNDLRKKYNLPLDKFWNHES